MIRLRAMACLAAVTWMAGARAAAGPVLDGTRPAAQGLPDDPGHWAGPDDPDIYTGLGYADKRAHPSDYRDRARLSALAQIARALSVSVRARAHSFKGENAEGFRTEWSESTSVSAEAELSGYRLERSRETAEGYWALYALDRETYERSRARAAAGFIAWLEAGAAALEADLGARRIQSAWDRARSMEDSLARRTGVPEGAEAASAAFGRAAARVREAARESEWAEPSGAWEYALPMGSEPRPPRPRLRLLDGAGAAWKGPYRIALNDARKPRPAACEAWTDAEGSLDPAVPFLGCGLEAGAWRVEWPVGDCGGARMEVEAAWTPVHIRLELETAPGAQGWASEPEALEALRRGLASRCGPRYRIGTGKDLPALRLRLTGAALDSLEGMRFASLRGELRLPGGTENIRLSGKGGHSDPARARERAREDFLEAAASLIPP